MYYHFLKILSWCFFCTPSPRSITQTSTFPFMGTTFTVHLAGPENEAASRELRSDIERELEGVNAQMSTYIPDSELSRFNAQETTDWFPVSPETARVRCTEG